MLCVKCKKNEATIRVIKMVNGEKSEMWLCEGCAKKMSEQISEIPLDIAINGGKNAKIESILGGFFEALNKTRSNDSEKKIDVICKSCGLRYSQFKGQGQLGCSKCYSSFEDSLKLMIKRLHGDTEHIGKIPKNVENDVIQAKRLRKLKDGLKKAIEEEEYEKAILLRDEIKNIKDKTQEVNHNE